MTNGSRLAEKAGLAEIDTDSEDTPSDNRLLAYANRRLTDGGELTVMN